MRVFATERGERPDLATKARVVAPQAVKYLADLLADKTFADTATIVIDWLGDMSWNGEGDMPAELRTPAVLVACEKRYPQYGNRLLTVDYVLDLEDFFGADNATKDDLHEIVENLEARAREEEQKKGL